MLIGLTGGIGSGKSTVDQILKENGCIIVDADDVSRQITADNMPVLEIISSKISKAVVHNGVLDRKALADIVFKDKQKLSILNSIMRDEILAYCKEQIENAKDSIVIFDVPLLFESGWDSMCDLTVVVVADLETKIKRVMSRDGVDRQRVLDRIANQMSDDEKILRASFVIDNSTNLENLRENTLNVLSRIKEFMV